MNYYQSEKEAYVVPRAIVFDVKVEEGFASSGEGETLPEKKIPNGAIDFSAREQQEKIEFKNYDNEKIFFRFTGGGRFGFSLLSARRHAGRRCAADECLFVRCND